MISGQQKLKKIKTDTEKTIIKRNALYFYNTQSPYHIFAFYTFWCFKHTIPHPMKVGFTTVSVSKAKCW